MNKWKKFLAILLVAVMLVPLISTTGYGTAVANAMETEPKVETQSTEDVISEKKDDAEDVEATNESKLTQQTEDMEATSTDSEMIKEDAKPADEKEDTEDQEFTDTETIANDNKSTEIEDKQSTEDKEKKEEIEESKKTEDPQVMNVEESVSLMSAMPLKEVEVSLVLNGKTDDELKSYSVDEMINNFQDSNGNKISVEGNPTTVWRYVKDSTDGVEEYKSYKLNNNEVIDLSLAASVSVYKMELIIGKGTQLNSNNVRYIVTVYITEDVREQIGIMLYEESESGVRTEAKVSKKSETYNSDLTAMFQLYGKQLEPMEVIQYVVPGYTDSSQYYLGITSEAAKHPSRNVDVYTFTGYMNYLTGTSAPITDQILNQNMKSSGAGYKSHFGMPSSINDALSSDYGYFFIVEKDSSGAEVRTTVLNFYIVPDEKDMSYVDSTVFDRTDTGIADVVCMEANSVSVDDIYVDMESGKANGKAINEYFYMLKDGIDANSDLYCRFKAHGSIYGDAANQYVEKAVVGLYSSLDEAAEQSDIKDQLFPTDATATDAGYKANYNYEDGGMYFTAFFEDGSVWQFNVRVMDYDPKYDESYVKSFTDAPIIGEKDPWFRVVGAENTDGSTLPTYIVENGKSINMDTMYAYGYQTVFIKDPSVTEITPIIDKADSENVKVTAMFIGDGKPYKEGDSIKLTDTETTVTFHVTISDQDGEHTKNYNVSFIKEASGPKLYVTDPKGGKDDDPVRSVFLDEYFEYKHDIFIANVGDQELTGLRVELDATNVKLDDYWTVGGEDSDTLAPFTTVDASVSDYAELPNVAKIRLVPEGEGDIEGKLTIYADNQKPVVIKLSGRAQNPSITTDQLEDAVKYVPYSHMITTNNMYDWNSVSFSYTGNIPDGMTLNESTGEIYGAPLEAGTYTFTVTATYGRSDYFEASTKEFTINVLDNENETVFKTSDSGYEIIPEEDGDSGYVGEQVSAYDFVLTSFDEDEVFISEGEYGQFVKLWLNGEELTEGDDYTTEPGSTKITIKSQTLKDKSTDGRNTISAEFNVNNKRGENLKRTSQNYRVDLASKKPTNPSGSNGTNDKQNSGNNGNTENNSNTGNASTTMPANNKATAPTSDSNDIESPTVNIITHVVGADGKALVNYIIEMHSTVKTATTDSSGDASFDSIEMGMHTVYIKDADGTTVASKNFKLQSGDSFSKNGDNFTVVPGQTISMTIKVDGSTASIESVKTVETVETGDTANIHLWLLLLMISTVALICLKVIRRKSIRK